MTFSIGDTTDKALVASIAHEMTMCRISYMEFIHLVQISDANPDTQINTVNVNSIYCRFLCHLYEFYIGCISRHRKSTSQFSPEIADKFITLEATKQISQIRIMIREGLAPKMTHEDIKTIQSLSVPPDFGKHFRLLRNRMSHALTERSMPSKAPDLRYMHDNYHAIFMILFNTAQLSWSSEHDSNRSWGDIGEYVCFHLTPNTSLPQKRHGGD